MRVKPQTMSVFRNSPLERGASSTLFKSLEEAGCVARESALGLDKMLKLVPFLPVPVLSIVIIPVFGNMAGFIFLEETLAINWFNLRISSSVNPACRQNVDIRNKWLQKRL